MMNLRRQAVLGLVERRWMTALFTLCTGRHAQTQARSRIHTLRIPMLICSHVQVENAVGGGAWHVSGG